MSKVIAILFWKMMEYRFNDLPLRINNRKFLVIGLEILQEIFMAYAPREETPMSISIIEWLFNIVSEENLIIYIFVFFQGNSLVLCITS